MHTKPRSYEVLTQYVRRLAKSYGVSYENFCFRALGIPVDDSQARQFLNPTQELLRRLSNGTGVAVEELEQMTMQRIWNRAMEEARQFSATPEGQAAITAWLAKKW